MIPHVSLGEKQRTWRLRWSNFVNFRSLPGSWSGWFQASSLRYPSPSTWALRMCASVWWSRGCLLCRRSAVTQRVRFPKQNVLAVTGAGNCLHLLLQWGMGTTVGTVKPAGATGVAWEEEPGVEGEWGWENWPWMNRWLMKRPASICNQNIQGSSFNTCLTRLEWVLHCLLPLFLKRQILDGRRWPLVLTRGRVSTQAGHPSYDKRLPFH